MFCMDVFRRDDKQCMTLPTQMGKHNCNKAQAVMDYYYSNFTLYI